MTRPMTKLRKQILIVVLAALSITHQLKASMLSEIIADENIKTKSSVNTVKEKLIKDIDILSDLADPLASWIHNGEKQTYTISQMKKGMGNKYQFIQLRMQKEKPEFIKKRMLRLVDGHLKDHLFLQIARKDGVERIGSEPVPQVINRWAEHILMKRLTVDPIKLQIFIKDVKKKYKNAETLTPEQLELGYKKSELRSQLTTLMDSFIKEIKLEKHYKHEDKK